MKEICKLLQQLRNYPDNFFVYSTDEYLKTFMENETRTGLVVCNHLGEEQGFIQTGSKGGVIIEA